MIPSVNLDFQVHETHDPRTISVYDGSIWAHIQGKPSIIEITLPGDKYPVTHYFEKGSVNIFNSQTLGLNCTDCGDGEYLELDDGIYEITLKGSPDSYRVTKSYLRTTKLKLELDKLYIKADLSCAKDKEKIEKLMLVSLLIRAAEANVHYGNACRADELYQKALGLVEKSKC